MIGICPKCNSKMVIFFNQWECPTCSQKSNQKPSNNRVQISGVFFYYDTSFYPPYNFQVQKPPGIDYSAFKRWVFDNQEMNRVIWSLKNEKELKLGNFRIYFENNHCYFIFKERYDYIFSKNEYKLIMGFWSQYL
jgi:hypothetical protein